MRIVIQRVLQAAVDIAGIRKSHIGQGLLILVGICDDDCEDLNLVLHDEKGNLISQDDSKDSTPVVEVTPKWTGKFKLAVRMASCKDAPCGYALTILSK